MIDRDRARALAQHRGGGFLQRITRFAALALGMLGCEALAGIDQVAYHPCGTAGRCTGGTGTGGQDEAYGDAGGTAGTSFAGASGASRASAGAAGEAGAGGGAAVAAGGAAEMSVAGAGGESDALAGGAHAQATGVAGAGGASATTTAQAGRAGAAGAKTGGAGMGGANDLAAAGAGTGGAPVPAAGAAGRGGATTGPAPVSCASHAACVEAFAGEPYLCLEGLCVALTTPDCPRVLGLGEGLENLDQPDPIVLGAYAVPFGDILEEDSPGTANFRLAVEEFNTRSLGGLPGGQDGTLRPVLLVVCDSYLPDLVASIDHLVGTLEVPAILAALDPGDLYQAFLLARQRANVLFMSPLSADDELVSVEDDRLLWHLLGRTEDLAPLVLKLLQRAEAFVNAQRAGTADGANPLRVTLVDSDHQSLTALANEIAPVLSFNGMTAQQNTDAGLLHRIRSPSSLIHAVADAAPVLRELQLHPPHVILAVATKEFPEQVVGRLELEWEEYAPNQARPFYILSHLLFADETMLHVFTSALGSPYQRAVGFNYAHYTDSELYDGYVSRLLAANRYYPNWYAERENYYDAAYYVFYALAAAAHQLHLTGDAVLAGLQRIIDTDAAAVPIGPAAVGEQVQQLWNDTSYRFQLIGTMGPPSFDAEDDRRELATSAWCIDQVPAAPAAVWQSVPDVLRYDPLLDELVGEFPCFAGF